MKKTRADIFRINSPYGIIIRLSDLRYSWFNRKYKEIYSDLMDDLSLDDLHKFEDELKDESVIEKINDFVEANRDVGVNSSIEKESDKSYLRVWLYNDENFPFNSGGEIKNKMNQYDKLLLSLERII